MKHIYNDGGRANYFKGDANDCVCRAVSIATGQDYIKVYNLFNSFASKNNEPPIRNGIRRKTWNDIKDYLISKGWKWVATMSIGSGCKVHLRETELPQGMLIVQVSKHLTCVKDGIIYDTFDCSRNGNRCVYGYFIK